MKQHFYSNGKLLISGEYLVLDGTKALAFPTKFGQSLTVETIKDPKIIWKSFDNLGKIWLEFDFNFNDLSSVNKKETLNDTLEKTMLISILKEAKKINPNFLKNNTSGYRVTTKLDFPINWGLGSSSTLINNIANWAKIDAFKLLEKTFGGSGYDIASAQHTTPILYTKTKNDPIINSVLLDWDFTEQLFFVHLNKKKNSREAIKAYILAKNNHLLPISEVSELTTKFIHCKNIQELTSLINTHEQLISAIIKQKPVKELLFKDYSGGIKSLGAWGGDFVLVTGDKSNWDYFRKKGFETILSFNEMIA